MRTAKIWFHCVVTVLISWTIYSPQDVNGQTIQSAPIVAKTVSGENRDIATERTFEVRHFNSFPDSPELQTGELVYSSTNLEIYKYLGDTTTINLALLSAYFDGQNDLFGELGIKDNVGSLYGAVSDLDGNGKIIIYLTNIIDEFNQGSNNSNPDLFVGGYSTRYDGTIVPDYLQGEIIYLDIYPQILGASPFENWNESMLHSLIQNYITLAAQSNFPEQAPWLTTGVGLMLQKRILGNIHWGSNHETIRPVADNVLFDYNVFDLHSRNSLSQIHYFFTYLLEKFPGATPDGQGMLISLAESYGDGIQAINSALLQNGYTETFENVFTDFAVASLLDKTQLNNQYNGRYDIEGITFSNNLADRQIQLLPWNTASGQGAPYEFNSLAPWSISYYGTRAYSINLAGDIVWASPDLSALDTLFSGGVPGQEIHLKKVILRSGFLDPITNNYEVADLGYETDLGVGMSPVTTHPDFVFGDTVPDAEHGAQTMILVVVKTNSFENGYQTDLVISNHPLTGQPPQNIQAIASINSIQVRWNPPSPIGNFVTESYNIFRREENEPEASLIASNQSGTTYYDENPTVSSNYFYGVQANFLNGSQSEIAFSANFVYFGDSPIGLRTSITNFGSIGDPNFSATGRPSVEFPPYSHNNYLYDGGLWIGAIVNDEPAVTTHFYNVDQEWLPRDSTWVGSRPEMGYFVPEDPSTPFTVYFDDIGSNIASGHVPLGLRVIETYEPGGVVIDPQSGEERVVPWGMLTYQIINSGLNGDLHNVFVSLWMDFDVSSIDMTDAHLDDLVDYDEYRMLSYMYDWDDPTTGDNDIGESGLATGFVGTSLISSPSNTVCSHAWWNWENDPESDLERYQFMNGTHLAMLGYQFMPNPLYLEFPVFDYRTLQSTGPFDIPAGDSITVKFLLVAGDGQDALFDNTQLARELYYTDVTDENNLQAPKSFALEHTYPNPFNATTTIRYELPEAANVKIAVFNILGQQVSVLRNAQQPAGRYQLSWNPQQAASGLYFIRLEAGGFNKTVKCLLLK